MTEMIRVNNLTTSYEDRTILSDLNFSVNKGDVFVITGPSGCGKTTLLNHLIGLLKPDHGDIFIQDKNIVTAEGRERIDILKNMGVMYQSGALFGAMTLLENVRLPLEEWTDLPLDAMNAICFNKLSLVNLLDAAYVLPAQISGGMRKRAAIARAMALDPAVLFLDEPSAGLDPVTSYELDQLILELSKSLQLTFVIVTHEVRSIMTIANNMIMLHDKQIIAQGHPHALQKHAHAYVKEFFDKGRVQANE